MITIKELKSKLKEMAAAIRAQRSGHREKQRELSAWETANPEWQKDWRSPVYKERYERLYKGPYAPDTTEYRHTHIAYCLARGRKYEEIEPKVREGNSPKWDKINAILSQIAVNGTLTESKSDEPQTVCAS